MTTPEQRERNRIYARGWQAGRRYERKKLEEAEDIKTINERYNEIDFTYRQSSSIFDYLDFLFWEVRLPSFVSKAWANVVEFFRAGLIWYPTKK